MSKSDVVEYDATVLESLPNTTFRVEVVDVQDPQKKVVMLCSVAGKMRMHYIKILPGDRVKIEVTPYDPSRGRIVFRYR